MRVSKSASKNQLHMQPIFDRKIVPKMTSRALLEASWDLLGPSWPPLGALSRASWTLLMVFRLPWSPQNPQKPSKGAPQELKTVPKHLRKGCKDAVQTINFSINLAAISATIEPFSGPLIQHLSRPGGTRGAIKY